MKTNVTKQYVDEIVRSYLPKSNDKVVLAMEYSLFSGGKRSRPILLLQTAQAVGGKINNSAKILATALEYIHTYSLIHDDLPCMDNDDLRRGKRSCHMQYGEAAAVLAGDGLLNQAMELVLTGPLANKNYQEACKFLFKMSGTGGMVLGQSLDLFSGDATLEMGNLVALHKTGDLLRGAVVCGALCGGANAEQVAIFDEIASKFGICYQIIDDMLDAEKCERSFLDVMTERELRSYVEDLSLQVKNLCKKLPYNLSHIEKMVDDNLSRNK